MKNNEIDKKMFGKRIRSSRIDLKLTQAELAEKIGISQNFLGDIERGIKSPSLENLISISNTLKLSLDSMFADSLNNVLCEEQEVYYTDRQLLIMKKVIRTINENF